MSASKTTGLFGEESEEEGDIFSLPAPRSSTLPTHFPARVLPGRNPNIPDDSLSSSSVKKTDPVPVAPTKVTPKPDVSKPVGVLFDDSGSDEDLFSLGSVAGNQGQKVAVVPPVPTSPTLTNKVQVSNAKTNKVQVSNANSAVAENKPANSAETEKSAKTMDQNVKEDSSSFENSADKADDFEVSVWFFLSVREVTIAQRIWFLSSKASISGKNTNAIVFADMQLIVEVYFF